MKNAYNLKTLPAWETYDYRPTEDKVRAGKYENLDNYPAALWSGDQSGVNTPPAIGERVTVTVNKIGPGVVESYFIEAGFLGVNVVLDNPIRWNGCKTAMSFGCEIEKEAR